MRFAIASNLSDQLSHIELFGNEVYEKAVQRMSADTATAPDQSSLEQFLVYIDFSDAIHALNRHKHLLPKNIASYVKGVTPRLEKLVAVRNRIAHSRPLLFDDLPSTVDVAVLFVRDNENFWTELSKVLKRLEKDPSFVLGLKIPTFTLDDN